VLTTSEKHRGHLSHR